MDNKTIVKAGAVQWDVELGDKDHNLDRALSFLDDLDARGVNLAVLPEMWASGFDYRNLDAHADLTPDILEKLKQKSASSGMTICGSLPENRNGRIMNTLFVVDSGRIAGSYSKIHLFTPTGEDRYFKGGDDSVVCRTSCGNLGLLICYDLRFPELCRSLALAGAEIIVCSAQWPEIRIGHWNTLLASRAIENQVFVVASNRCGSDYSIAYGGSSRIITPFGIVAAECGTEESSAVAEMQMEEISSYRSMIPCLEHIRNEAYRVREC